MNNLVTGTVIENSAAVFMASFLNELGTLPVAADFSSIGVKVFDLADPASAVYSASLTPSDVVFSSLQASDPRWSADAAGPNFIHKMPASVFSEGDKTYRVEYKFTPTTAQIFYIRFEVRSETVFTE